VSLEGPVPLVQNSTNEAAAEAEAMLTDSSEVFSERRVSEALDGIAQAVAAQLGSAEPTVLAMMHGGLYATVELCKRFRFAYRFDYLHGTRYLDALSGGEMHWPVPPKPSLAGRCVLLVDDVLDHGHTLREACTALRLAGVSRLYTAVLVVKDVNVPDRPTVDFVGLHAPDRYLFGCGMDYRGYWRGLPSIRAVGVNDAI
jgi:hypoxanthine phosphoribosyltransferase